MQPKNRLVNPVFSILNAEFRMCRQVMSASAINCVQSLFWCSESGKFWVKLTLRFSWASGRKMNSRIDPLLWILALVGVASLFIAYDDDAFQPAKGRSSMATSLNNSDPIYPVPPPPALDPRKLALGQALFSSPMLSRDQTVSCASCHDLSSAGHDPRRVSLGVGGAEGAVNSPTVFNAALNVAQFWDGRAATLEQQVYGPFHNPVEMDANWPEVIARLKQDTAFHKDFERVYPQGLSAETIVDAIATFEKSLLTPNAPFDRYLQGDEGAIGASAKAGHALFSSLGCISCHQGVNVGGNMFQHFGILGDYFGTRALPVQSADLGRFNVTGKEEDRFVFKVPGLRNVARTAPYFHDGLSATLAEAIVIMGRHQLGIELSPGDVGKIDAFLQTINGELPAQLGQKAALP